MATELPANGSDPDVELARRLERLAARSSAGRTGAHPTTSLPAGTIPTGPPTAPRPAGPAAPTAPTAASIPRPGVSRPHKRRHAAARSRMAALALSITTTAGLAATLGLTSGSSATLASSAQGGIVETAATPLGSTGSVGSTASTGSTAATVVNGDVYTNRFGPVQVQATFAADGSLTGVDAIQFPDGDGKSVRINDRAVPVLNSEALTAQSAQVDTISGATYTSRGYAQSLQSAIDEARVAGLTDLA